VLLECWILHAALAVVLSLPTLLLGRHRANWRVLDSLALVVPFVVWSTLLLTVDNDDKQLGNLKECFVLSLAIPVAAAIRVMVGDRRNSWLTSAILILLFMRRGCRDLPLDASAVIANLAAQER